MKIKRWFLFLIPLFMSIIPLIIFSQDDVATTSPKTLDEYIREGKTRKNRFFFDEAKAVFEEALKFYPEDWRLHWYYLNLCERMGPVPDEGSTPKSILTFYEGLIKENPENPAAYAGLAYCYLEWDKRMLARETANKAREIDENSLAALHIHTIILKSEGNAEEEKREMILKAYNVLLQNYPDFFEGYQDFFKELIFRIDFETNPEIDFHAKWERALRCSNFDPIVYLLEARNLRSRDDEDKYVEIYQKIIRQDPTHARIRFYLTRKLIEMGKWEQGFELLKETVSEAPNFSEAAVFLAQVYSGLLEYDRSNEILAALMEKFKRDYYEYDTLYTMNMYRSGRFEEAIQFLEKKMRDPERYMDYREEKLLSSLQSRKPDERVKIIPGIPFLIQKWNFCGPASVSMILQYWGLPYDQDQIAEKIFIKGMGTIPKTTQNYIHSLGFRTFIFKGSEEIWKQALDLDIPVLMSYFTYDDKSGHVVVIAGYDDFAGEFIIHDPNYPNLQSLPYSRDKDKFIYGSWYKEVRQCMLIIPEDRVSQVDLDFIKTPLSIRALNLLAHILAGSAILSGLITGLLLNGAFVLVILFLAYIAIRKTIFPYSPKALWRFLAVCFILELAITAAGVAFNSQATSIVLIVYHLGLSLFLLICIYFKGLHILLQFYVPLGFFIRSWLVSLGLGILFYATLAEKNELISAMVIVIAVLIIFYPLILLIYFKYLVDNKKYSAFFRRIRRFRWIKGEKAGYLSAAFMEAVVYLYLGEHDKSLAILREILGFPYLTRQCRFRIKTLILENLLEKLKEHPSDQEEISGKADLLIKEIESDNPKGWNRFTLLLLFTDFSVIKGSYKEAEQFQKEADKIFSSKKISIVFQKKLENIRFFVERLRSVIVHYDLNRLALARHFEQSDIIEDISKKYKDKQDLDFKRNRLLQDLTKQ